MQRALRLALKGSGFVNPNPMVGAVIVKDEKIIGEGYHTRYGQPHAEIEALRNATESVKGATAYVTLEPCSHYGKTPPCAEALIRANISKVVIATLDPNPLVSGRGVRMLENAGVKVITGVLESEAKLVNKIFLKYIRNKTPYVVMKTAMTLDGKIATVSGDSRWVSGEESRKEVHRLRHALMGIMVGVNTVLADNPQLNCRMDNIEICQPTKIVVDSHLRTPLDARLWNDGKLIIATTEQVPKTQIAKYEAQGARVVVAGKDKCVDLQLLMQKLGALGIDSILLEGGATLNSSALFAGIVDEVWTFIAPKIVGGQSAPSPVGGEGVLKMNDAYKLVDLKSEIYGEDILLKGIIQK